MCIKSVADLEAQTGARVTDLHRHFIDHLTIPSRQGKGVLRRVEVREISEREMESAWGGGGWSY